MPPVPDNASDENVKENILTEMFPVGELTAPLERLGFEVAEITSEGNNAYRLRMGCADEDLTATRLRQLLVRAVEQIPPAYGVRWCATSFPEANIDGQQVSAVIAASPVRTLRVLNIDDLERDFRNRAAHLFSPDAKQWLVTVAKNYLLNVDGRLDETDKQENFAHYHRDWEKLPLDGVPEVLLGWIEEALHDCKPVFVYDPVQPTRRAFWTRKIQRIVNWFNSKPPPVIDWQALSFQAALRGADDWYQENGLR